MNRKPTQSIVSNCLHLLCVTACCFIELKKNAMTWHLMLATCTHTVFFVFFCRLLYPPFAQWVGLKPRQSSTAAEHLVHVTSYLRACHVFLIFAWFVFFSAVRSIGECCSGSLLWKDQKCASNQVRSWLGPGCPTISSLVRFTSLRTQDPSAMNQTGHPALQWTWPFSTTKNCQVFLQCTCKNLQFLPWPPQGIWLSLA